MRRCWLKGETGDALNAVLAAAGFNIRWLMRAIVAKGIRPLRLLFLRLFGLAAMACAQPSHGDQRMKRGIRCSPGLR